MVKLRDLAEANKKDGDVLLSNTPTPMTAEIKEKVFLPLWEKSDKNSGKEGVKRFLEVMKLGKIYFAIRGHFRTNNFMNFFNFSFESQSSVLVS